MLGISFPILKRSLEHQWNVLQRERKTEGRTHFITSTDSDFSCTGIDSNALRLVGSLLSVYYCTVSNHDHLQQMQLAGPSLMQLSHAQGSNELECN